MRQKASNTGSRSCWAWPILLIDRAFGTAQRAVGAEGLLLEEARDLSPEARKYSSEVRVCSWVEKTDDRGRVEAGDDLLGPLDQRVARRRARRRRARPGSRRVGRSDTVEPVTLSPDWHAMS